MKREINMRKNNDQRNTKKGEEQGRIITDPFGSYTGVPLDSYNDEKPVQDVDDL